MRIGVSPFPDSGRSYASALGQQSMVEERPEAEVRRRDRTGIMNIGSSLVSCIVVLIAIRTALNRRPGARPKGRAPHAQLSPGGEIHVIAHMNELRGGHGSRKCGCRQSVKIAKPDLIGGTQLSK
jgi:hypothetical protein